MVETGLNKYWIQYINDQIANALINHEGPHRKDVWLAYIKIQDGSGLDQNDDKILIEFLSNEESIS